MYPYIKIFSIYIPTYGICVCIAVFLCSILVFQKSRKENVNFNDLLVIIAISIGCGMIGGNLLYIVITYDFTMICEQIIVGNLLFLKNSGTVFYGGLIGGVLGAVITAKILNFNIETLETCVVPYIPLGHAIGRIGCLLAGCCYGFRYSGMFCVSTIFDLEGNTYFPIQVVESMLNLVIVIILMYYTKRKRFKYSIILVYLIMYSFGRFCLEFLRGDEMRGKFLFFSTSQWISLMLFLVSLSVICIHYIKDRRIKIGKD